MGAAITEAGEGSKTVNLTCTPDRFTQTGSATMIKSK
jgi:hypothetical protein